jgi:predicted HTH domain antitoxin
METLTLTLPPGLSPEEARPLIAAKLFEAHRLSLGQATEMAGLEKGAFMKFLGAQNIAVFDYPADLETEARR